MIKRVFQFKRMYIWCLLPLTALAVIAARLDNRWVEHFYVPFIYRPLSSVIGRLVSLAPFSVTEWIIALLAVALVAYIVFIVVRLIKHREGWKHTLYTLFVNAVCALSITLFAFELTMGLNYYRRPVKDSLGLDVKESTLSELYGLCGVLVNDLNYYRARMKTDENGISVLSDSNRYETSAAARDSYNALAEKIPALSGASIRNKPLISSKFFSSLLTTGIFFPVTFESCINVDVPSFTIPATMCHEQTHFRGFMREDEANFLGYLACMESERADFRYSGTLMAFEYCYSRLRREDKTLAQELASLLDGGIIDDVNAEDDYWDKYIGKPAARISGNVYNSYLQSQNQQSGTKSYGEMLDLLLAYYRAGNMISAQ